MKIGRFLFTFSIGLAVILSGCGGGTPAGGGGTGTSGGDSRGGGGGCPGGSPAGSELLSPAMWDIVDDLMPSLDWAYTDPACPPDSYSVHLRTGPFFGDDLGASSTDSSWTPPSALEPGTEYAWGIQAIDDAVTGPYTGERYFFTGPLCDPAELKAPMPLTPINHWVVDDLGSLSLIWDYPDGCLPEYYQIDLATSTTFTGSPLNGSTGNPSTRWGPGQPLADCTRYFWRVRGGIDSNLGPYSPIYTFRVDLQGNCPAEQSGMIQGTVWEDQCLGPGAGTPMPPQPPLGCVFLNGDQLSSNQSYDPGEPGIPGVVVTLGQGACPSTGYQSVVSGPDGMFDFYELPAGTYCVTIDGKDPTNNPILWPGSWTFPLQSHGYIIAEQTIQVNSGQDLKNVNFGWWYKMGTGWGSENSTVFGLLWHDLCAYHPGDPAPDPLPAGCVSDAFGVHADGIHQSGEQGIPGVIVSLGQGECPSAGLATAATDVNGYYHFNDLPAGDYCIGIDPNSAPTNASILPPGRWTTVFGLGSGLAERRTTMIANHTLPGQDFGWDYDNLPLTVQLSQAPVFTLQSNANCRKGPDKRYSVVTSVLAGQSFPIEGRNDDGSWFKVLFKQYVHCWLAATTGSANVLSDDIGVVAAPALATDTPQFNCADFKDRSSCSSHLACEWYQPPGARGSCRNRN